MTFPPFPLNYLPAEMKKIILSLFKWICMQINPTSESDKTNLIFQGVTGCGKSHLSNIMNLMFKSYQYELGKETVNDTISDCGIIFIPEL